MGSPAAAPAQPAARGTAMDSDDEYVAPKARSRKILDSADEAEKPAARPPNPAPLVAAPAPTQRAGSAKPKGKAKSKPKKKANSDSESSFISSDSESEAEALPVEPRERPKRSCVQKVSYAMDSDDA